MALKYTPKSEISQAPSFNLLGVDGQHWSLNQVMGVNGLVVMFICNHCPYVKSIQQQLVEDVKQLQSFAVNAVAIMSNDPVDYAEDSFENMQAVAKKLPFT
ncbi:PPO candidate 1, partial [hydrothermal vent metagenome]